MPTLTTAAKNAVVDALVNLIDAGTTDANGDLVIRNAANGALSTHAFTNPAFGDAASGTATAAAIGDETSATAGTADDFIFQDRDNTEVLEGTVGTSGAELNLSSTSFGAGDTVQITSFTVSYP